MKPAATSAPVSPAIRPATCTAMTSARGLEASARRWDEPAQPTAALASYWTWREPTTCYRHRPVQPMALLTFVLYPIAVVLAVVCGASGSL